MVRDEDGRSVSLGSVEGAPDLEPADVAEALHYAAEALRERELAATRHRVKLLLDNNVSPQLVGPLEEAGHRVEHVRDHGPRAAVASTSWGSPAGENRC